MEMREFFIIAFAAPQPIGEQAAESAEHFTMIGYLRPDPQVTQQYTISEHVERIALKKLALRGKKLKRLGRFMVTTLADDTGALTSAKDKLFAALKTDGYICSRPNFYRGNYQPHVTVGRFSSIPGAPAPKKLDSFDFNNVSVAESRFDLDYEFLGSKVISTRNF